MSTAAKKLDLIGYDERFFALVLLLNPLHVKGHCLGADELRKTEIDQAPSRGVLRFPKF